MGGITEGRSTRGCARCGIGGCGGGGTVQPTLLQPVAARSIGFVCMSVTRCGALRRLARVFGSRTRTSACNYALGPGTVEKHTGQLEEL